MVIACVMNQSRDHWLLFNVLINAITLIIKLQTKLVKLVQVSNGIEVLDQFDSKHISLQKKDVGRSCEGYFKPFF
jgi:hypothetical protein